MKRNDLIISVAILGFAIACIVSGSGESALILPNERLPAHLYANLLAGLLVVVTGGYLLVGTILKTSTVTGRVASDGVLSGMTFLVATISVLYTLGITYVGFYVTTIVCLLLLYLGFENWQMARLRSGLVFSLSVCAIFFVSFRYLRIYLPSGLLF